MSQLLFCSIVIQNNQIFYGAPVMFIVTCFLAQPNCRKFLHEQCESAKLRARVLGVLTCLRAQVFGVLTCLPAYVLVCSRACVLKCLACSHAWRACMHVLCLRASYDACLVCLPLTYSRFCLIIYFVCINQGFAIKRKLLIHVNLS